MLGINNLKSNANVDNIGYSYGINNIFKDVANTKYNFCYCVTLALCIHHIKYHENS